RSRSRRPPEVAPREIVRPWLALWPAAARPRDIPDLLPDPLCYAVLVDVLVRAAGKEHKTRRAAQFVDRLLQQPRGFLQEVGVGRADVHVDLAVELRTQLPPILAQDSADIVFLPGFGYVAVDFSGRAVK